MSAVDSTVESTEAPDREARVRRLLEDCHQFDSQSLIHLRRLLEGLPTQVPTSRGSVVYGTADASLSGSAVAFDHPLTGAQQVYSHPWSVSEEEDLADWNCAPLTCTDLEVGAIIACVDKQS